MYCSFRVTFHAINRIKRQVRRPGTDGGGEDTVGACDGGGGRGDAVEGGGTKGGDGVSCL